MWANSCRCSKRPRPTPEPRPPVRWAHTHYGAAQDLAQAEQAGLTVIAPLFEGKPKGDNPYHASEFTYDTAADQVVCPQGQVLPLQGEKDRRGVAVKVYRCHCQGCPRPGAVYAGPARADD